MRMQQPELYALSSIEWQLFCTFTFKQDKLTERVRLAMFFAVARTTARNFGLHWNDLFWVVRQERGETFGRLHYHCLIAGLPSHGVHWATCNSTEKLWVRFGGGHAKVSEFNPSLEGVDYILKHGDEMARSLASRWAGDYHELTKFGGPCDLMLSVSLCSHIFNRSRVGHRGRGYGDESRGTDKASSTEQSGVRQDSYNERPLFG
jgi:hypothetical protein